MPSDDCGSLYVGALPNPMAAPLFLAALTAANKLLLFPDLGLRPRAGVEPKPELDTGASGMGVSLKSCFLAPPKNFGFVCGDPKKLCFVCGDPKKLGFVSGDPNTRPGFICCDPDIVLGDGCGAQFPLLAQAAGSGATVSAQFGSTSSSDSSSKVLALSARLPIVAW